MKRVLCLLLCAVLVCTAFVPSAGALLVRHETADDVMPTTEEKMDILNAAVLTPMRTNYQPLDTMVEQILAEILTPEMTTYEKVRACYAYLMKDTVYVKGNDTTNALLGTIGKTVQYKSGFDRNLVCCAYGLLKEKSGECVHYSSAFVALTRAIGLESYLITCLNSSSYTGTGDHVASVVRINGSFYIFDPVIGVVETWQSEVETSGYFCVPLASTASREFCNINETLSQFGGFQTGTSPSERTPETIDGQYAGEVHYTFGSYPQSRVTDGTLISALNRQLDQSGMRSFGYCVGNNEPGSQKQDDYMKYADVVYGGETYRAVTFTQYRPYFSYYNFDAYTSHQRANGYETGVVYWFRFDPIEWRLADGNNLLVSDMLLDAQPYNNGYFQSGTAKTVNGGKCFNFADAACKGAANDWSASSIRAWLNEDFYNTAFSSSEQSLIRTSHLNNYGYRGYFNDQATDDKVFLLSMNELEAENLCFAADASALLATGTDYAGAQGLSIPKRDTNRYSIWRTRTASLKSGDAVSVSKIGRFASWGNVAATMLGVRPALRVDPAALQVSGSGDAPRSAAAAATDTGEITVRSAVVSGALSYKFYLYRGQSDTYEAVYTSASPSIVIRSLTPGVRYRIRTSALCPAKGGVLKESALSSSVAVVCKTMLSAPQGLTAAGGVTGSVTLQWTPLPGAASYRIYKYIDSDTIEQCAESNEAACTVTGLMTGVKYAFRVAGVSAEGDEGALSTIVTCLCKSYPEVPGFADAKATATGEITLSWNASAGAARYRIYRYTSAADVVEAGNTADTSYTVRGLHCGTVYAFYVTAETKDGASVSSKTKTLRCEAVSMPPIPENITLTPTATGEITVAWNAVTGAAAYNVYRYINSTDLTKVGATAGKSLRVTGLRPGVSYAFRVEAVSKDGKDISALSATAKTTCLSIPSIPENVTLTPTATGEITVAWNAVTGAAAYNVYRYINSTDLTKVGATAGKSLRVTGLRPGVSYAFRVEAVSKDGKDISALSTAVKTACLSIPAVPANVKAATTAHRTVTVSWDPVPGAAAYKVYRYVSSTDLALVGTTAGTALAVPGLSTGVNYAFKVEAVSADGADVSAKSDIVRVRCEDIPLIPLEADLITLNVDSVVYNGKQRTPTLTVKNAAGETLKAGRDYTVAVPAGRTEVGTYVYKITGAGAYGGTVKKTFTITQALKAAAVTFNADGVTYNGKVRTPAVTVKNAAGTTLKAGTDYTVTAPDGRTAAGTYTYKITGKGIYSGTITKVFRIAPQPLRLANVTLNVSAVTWNGKLRTPTVLVKNTAGETLKAGTDYTVTVPAGRTAAGTYTYQITGRGNYSGTVERLFRIRAQALTEENIAFNVSEVTYNGKERNPAVTVKNAAGTKLKAGTDYTVTVPAGRTKAGTYTYKITGMGNYGGTVKKVFTIRALPLQGGSISFNADGVTYNGKVRTPAITVKNAAGTSLKAGTDYTVTAPAGRINAGAYTYIVTGKGNYSGTLTKVFRIAPQPLRLANVTLNVSAVTYNGKLRTPTVLVKNTAGETLKAGTDYTVTVPAGRTAAGTYTYKITGKGNYSGTVERLFRIYAQALTEENVAFNVSEVTYNGKERNPAVTVKNAAGTKLKAGTDYTVTVPAGRTKAGTYTYKITGMGNYSGTVKKIFTIK